MKTKERDQMQFSKANLKKMMGEIHKEASEEAQREMELERKYGKIKNAEGRMEWTSAISIVIFVASFFCGLSLLIRGEYNMSAWCWLSLCVFLGLFLLNESASLNLEPIQKGQFVLTCDTERIKRLARQME
jgi:hypothetical protein